VIVLVRQAGFKVSESTVGRILAELVKKGRCLKALAYSRRNRQRKAVHRFHAQRIKYKLQPRFAGEGIQIDSMSLGGGGHLSSMAMWNGLTGCVEESFMKCMICLMRFLICALQSLSFKMLLITEDPIFLSKD